MKGKFQIELSDFSFVRGYSGKILRLTFSWKFEDTETGQILGVATEGCLVARDASGKLVFSLPMVGWSKGGAKKQVHQLSKDLHSTVIDLLSRTRFPQHIGRDINLDLPETVQDLDPELPVQIQSEIIKE